MTKLGQMIFDDGVKKGLEQGIEVLIQDNLEEGISEKRIIAKLQKNFSLSRKEAENIWKIPAGQMIMQKKQPADFRPQTVLFFPSG